MKINYKILWLDDKAKTIIDDGYDTEIVNYLKELHFEPFITLAKNETEFFENLNDDYDLILTDYHLEDGNNRNGDIIIKETREKAIFTEIMFYSAKGNVVDTTKLDRITFVDTSRNKGDHYDTVIEKAKDLINLTVKKFQNIILMRGMIMNETSALDVEIEDILSKIITKGNSDEIIKIIKAKFLETNVEFASKISNCENVSDLLNYIGADHRVRSIIRNIDKGEIKNILLNYTKEIIVVRNQFAHAVLESNTNTFKTRNGIIFNDAECVNIRKNINRHIKNLKDLQIQLTL